MKKKKKMFYDPHHQKGILYSCEKKKFVLFYAFFLLDAFKGFWFCWIVDFVKQAHHFISWSRWFHLWLVLFSFGMSFTVWKLCSCSIVFVLAKLILNEWYLTTHKTSVAFYKSVSCNVSALSLSLSTDIVLMWPTDYCSYWQSCFIQNSQ